jgi:hypothetical protein
MSADLDIRPVVDDGTRAAGARGRNRLTWLVAAAAVAVIAGVGGVAISGLAGDDTSPPTAGKTTGPGTTELTASGAPVAGQTTELTVAAQQGKCATATPQILAQYTQAFAGTVTAIEGNAVTLQASDVYQGEIGETVHVTAPQPLFDNLLTTVQFQEGKSYLVAAYDGQVSVCYSGPATGQLRSPFEKAFLH